MGRSPLERTEYSPASMRVIIQAFDEAWQEVAVDYSADIADVRRRLALLILNAADRGERDVAHLKDAALKAMRRSEEPTGNLERLRTEN
jgi:hypothetical protein